jgi:hypothetical protein
MKKFLRFTALVTLAAFLGLSTLEAFHHHDANQTTDNCAICQIAHQTPALLGTASAIGPHQASVPARAAVAPQTYVQFVFVAHGLSPPIL